jgi:hypothetical protein
VTPLLWQILIPHIAGARHAKLCALLDVLAPQMMPGVEVVIYADNLEASYEAKLQALTDSATADYVSVLSDDDMVAPDFIPRVTEAMAPGPDYVGFRVRYTEDGIAQRPVIHSLACGGWNDNSRDGEMHRDLMYYNPVRREHAQRVRFRGPTCDIEWADDLRALGCVRTEVFIDAELHYYQRVSSDNFHTARQPLPAGEIPDPPARPFARYLDPARSPHAAVRD